jgi:hypothetical protein
MTDKSTMSDRPTSFVYVLSRLDVGRVVVSRIVGIRSPERVIVPTVPVEARAYEGMTGRTAEAAKATVVGRAAIATETVAAAVTARNVASPRHRRRADRQQRAQDDREQA